MRLATHNNAIYTPRRLLKSDVRFGGGLPNPAFGADLRRIGVV